jgi:DNA-binding transcriptional LysR family regulator
LRLFPKMIIDYGIHYRDLCMKSVSQRLRSVDLNLLPVLRQVLADRNITRAADALALSQPAVSKALARLRVIFGDPLLVRDGRRMILTPRAEQLQPEVEEQCRRLEQLWVEDRFVAETSRREFKIASTDYEALTVLPELAPALREEAPYISLSFREMLNDFQFDHWSEVDLVVAADEVIASFATADVIKVPLLREDFVTVVGPDHPLATGESELGEPVRQLTYRPGASPQDLFARMQPMQPAHPLATLPTFTVLPILALLTDTAAFVPRMVAMRFARFLPLTIVEGVGPRATVTISMAWHRRWHEDGGHRWLRDLIVARCTDACEGARSPAQVEGSAT